MGILKQGIFLGQRGSDQYYNEALIISHPLSPFPITVPEANAPALP